MSLLALPAASRFAHLVGVVLFLLGALLACKGLEATDETYRKNLTDYDRELARAPQSLRPEMEQVRAGFERRRAAITVPSGGSSKELTALSREVSTTRAVYSGKVTDALCALALPELRAADWIGDFRTRRGRVEERVEVTPEGRLIAHLHVRIGSEDTTRPEGGAIVAVRKDALVYRPLGLDASDEVFGFETGPRRGPEGLEFVRAGKVYRAK